MCVIFAPFGLPARPICEVQTATGALGSPNGGRGADLAILPGILEPRLLSVVLEPMTNARLAINSDARFRLGLNL